MSASTALNCASPIIGLEPCALNAEYQHFIRRFIKMSFYFADTTERGGERRPKDRVKTRVTLWITLLHIREAANADIDH